MKTLDEVLEILETQINRSTLEDYIAREWVRPISSELGWHFEEIDIARLQLVHHLSQVIQVNDEGLDVVLSILDQLYGLRTHMHKLTQAIAQQPPQIRTEIMMIIDQLTKAEKRT